MKWEIAGGRGWGGVGGEENRGEGREKAPKDCSSPFGADVA